VTSERADTAAVLGGSVSGLAAAEGLTERDVVGQVTVFERQQYDEKRVNCGEAINDTDLIPLRKTQHNGFVNNIDGFELRVYSDRDRSADEPPLETARFPCPPGYICERDTVERRWAERLRQRGVEFRTGETISLSQYTQIVDDYDYVVDATGQPAISLKARDLLGEYVGEMVALNARVEGTFEGYRRWPRIFFEGYLGYSWVFPQSSTTANVGIGWGGSDRPDDYMRALTAAAERNGFDKPDREATRVYTIPRGPSLSPEYVYFPEDSVFLVGDAAGVANRYQGEGICQGIRSSYLLCRLLDEGRAYTYPRQLYQQMRSEYRLAHLMRGAWAEHTNSQLLAELVAALDGITISEITRSVPTVVGRLLQQPTTTARLLADRGMLRRVYESYTDEWEYSEAASAE
jgi:digeranylgeranylglycerophospholipid reductase